MRARRVRTKTERGLSMFEGQVCPLELSYCAFISYRTRRDPDHWIAEELESFIEGYSVPPEVAVRGFKNPRDIGRVFRDLHELPATADLPREIEIALEQSLCLLVVCTPNTPVSPWIGKEIEYFVSLGRGKQIYTLLGSGSPTDSFHSALPNSSNHPAKDLFGPANICAETPEDMKVLLWQEEGARFVAQILSLSHPDGLECKYNDLRRRDLLRLEHARQETERRRAQEFEIEKKTNLRWRRIFLPAAAAALGLALWNYLKPERLPFSVNEIENQAAPLFWAIDTEPESTNRLRRLVQLGADPLSSDGGMTALHYATREHNFPAAVYLYRLEPTAILQVEERSTNALHIAAGHNSIQICPVLLTDAELGYKALNERDNYGLLPLEIACETGSLDIFRILWEATPNKAEALRVIDQRGTGNSLLHIACQRDTGAGEVAIYLLQEIEKLAIPPAEFLLRRNLDEATPILLASYRYPEAVRQMTHLDRGSVRKALTLQVSGKPHLLLKGVAIGNWKVARILAENFPTETAEMLFVSTNGLTAAQMLAAVPGNDDEIDTVFSCLGPTDIGMLLEPGSSGSSALARAIEEGNWGFIKALIRLAGADKVSDLSIGEQGVFSAMMSGTNNGIGVPNELLDLEFNRGRAYLEMRNDEGRTLALEAVSKGNVSLITRLLDEGYMSLKDLSSVDLGGQNALHIAANANGGHGQDQTVEFLLHRLGDHAIPLLMQQDANGDTPLLCVLRSGSVNPQQVETMVRAIVKVGDQDLSFLKVRGRDGRSAHELAKDRGLIGATEILESTGLAQSQ